MRSVAVVLATVIGALLAAVGPASGGVSPTVPITKAESACTLLTSEEITAVFTDAPLGRGPTRVKLPNHGNQDFSQCLWNDKKVKKSVPQLLARTTLARGLTKAQEKLLTTPTPNTTSRALTATELEGIGSKGVIEIKPGGVYASVAALIDDDLYIVSVGYLGAAPPAPISDAAILALARQAALRV
jgi:hypothetical protein